MNQFEELLPFLSLSSTSTFVHSPHSDCHFFSMFFEVPIRGGLCETVPNNYLFLCFPKSNFTISHVDDIASLISFIISQIECKRSETERRIGVMSVCTFDLFHLYGVPMYSTNVFRMIWHAWEIKSDFIRLRKQL